MLPPPPPPSEAGGSSGRFLTAHHTITISAISGTFSTNINQTNPQDTGWIVPAAREKFTPNIPPSVESSPVGVTSGTGLVRETRHPGTRAILVALIVAAGLIWQAGAGASATGRGPRAGVVHTTELAGAQDANGSPAASPDQKLAVPAYFSPGRYWTQMDHSHPPLELAVMNPSSGPGTSLDTAYLKAVRAAKAAGILVLGYVDTDYGKRALAEVKGDVDDYYHWYGVDGIFFDRASTDCARESYYAELDRFVKHKGGPARTVLNPGTQTNQCYEPAADVLLTFEGSASTYLHSYSAPKWISHYPASHFWHVVYATPTTSALAHVVRLSEQRHAGLVYVTPKTLPNPYDALPTGVYWSDEKADIAH